MIVFMVAHMLLNGYHVNFHIDFWSIKTWDAIFVTWYFFQMVAFFIYMDSNTDQHGMPFRKGGERAIRHHKYWCRAANSFQAHQISHSICSLICTFVFYPEVLSASCHSYQSFVRAFIHVAPFLLISLEVFLSRIPIRVSYIFLIAIWYYIAAINVGFINVLRTSTNVLSNLSFDHFNHYIYPYGEMLYLVPLTLAGQSVIVFMLHLFRHHYQTPIVDYEYNPHSMNLMLDEVGHTGKFSVDAFSFK